MTFFKPIFIFTFLLMAEKAMAQTDPFAGTWNMVYTENVSAKPVKMEISIANPENNLLYPAQLKLQCDSFSAVYDLLLVKRNSRQLSIGRNKIPVSETPFSLGNWTVYLNGTLDFSKDLKGLPVLSLNRIVTRQFGLPMPELKYYQGSAIKTASRLLDFMKTPEIILRRSNSETFQGEHCEKILHSPSTGDYFGILDTVYVNSKDGLAEFPGSKKSSNGVVSVMRNGSTIIDQADLSYKKPNEEFVLDTGMNLLVFFADNYGKSPASTGKMDLLFGKKKMQLNFADKKDLAATFIVARIIYIEQKEERSANENELSKLSPEFRTLNDDNVYYYPDKWRNKNAKSTSPKTTDENSLLRESKLLGNIDVSSRQITLAIWDDAVEDGDSISLSINGNWVVQGLAVKKRPQFIIVTVEPGQNKITFIADNLGSISPNTSVLEIIDGKKRRSFMIDTNLRQNNLVNIFYDLKPGD